LCNLCILVQEQTKEVLAKLTAFALKTNLYKYVYMGLNQSKMVGVKQFIR